MDPRRDTRRLAMQLLYAIDVGRLGRETQADEAPPNAPPPVSDAYGAADPSPPGESPVSADEAPTETPRANGDAAAEPTASTHPVRLDAAADPPVDRDAVLAAIDADFDADPAIHGPAADLALSAWAARDDADAVFTELAPDWPTPRRPPVDRAILRLAWCEMATARVPVRVAINEAIELAKAYAGEESPLFINGVLDKAAKRLPAAATTPAPAASTGTAEDAWLADAVRDPAAANDE